MPDLKTIALVAHFAGDAGREKIEYLERLDRALHPLGYRLLLIDQAGRALESACAIATIPAESLHSTSPLPEPLRLAWEKTPALQHAVDCDAAFYRLDDDAAARRVLLPAAAIFAILQAEAAVLCVLWHQFNGVCMALAEFCRAARLPVCYTHLGPLPGAIIFETGGQMAESWVCTENERFLALPVSEPDLVRTRDYLAHARQTRADRKPQITDWSIADSAARLRASHGHLLFMAGQNDFRTGMAPRSLPNAALHSPCFADTAHALTDLAAASAGRWGILFKPHPSLMAQQQDLVLAGVENVAGANVFECIEAADLTVTVVSTTAYLALIHQRPVLLLGRMLLSGKGCVYEATTRDEIPGVVQRACAEGLTDAQRAAFERHSAQMLRHYLFAFDAETEAHIGRGPECAAQYLTRLSG